MPDIYDRGRALAIRLLAPRSAGGKGLECTVRRAGDDAYDPETGGTAVTYTDAVGSALRTRFTADEIDGTLVLASDVKFIVSPALPGGAPVTGDLLVFDGSTYNVRQVSAGNYAGLDVVYFVQGRA